MLCDAVTGSNPQIVFLTLQSFDLKMTDGRTDVRLSVCQLTRRALVAQSSPFFQFHFQIERRTDGRVDLKLCIMLWDHDEGERVSNRNATHLEIGRIKKSD